MKHATDMYVCIAYITFLVALTVGDVGEVSTSCGEPYPWYLPLGMFVMLILPAWLGFNAGRHAEKQRKA